jgi:hypothetical protein
MGQWGGQKVVKVEGDGLPSEEENMDATYLLELFE